MAGENLAPTVRVLTESRGIRRAIPWYPLACAAVLVVFTALVLAYSLSIPPLEAPGEARALHIIQTDGAREAAAGGLPGATGADSIAAPAPPLYGWLARILTGWLPEDRRGPSLAANEGAGLWHPGGVGNRNAFLHTGERLWPWRGEHLALGILRTLSWLLSLGTIIAGYYLARLVSPKRPAIAVGTAGVIAFTPAFIASAATAGPDTLSALITSASLLGCAHLALADEPAGSISAWLASCARMPRWLREPWAWRALAVGALVGLGGLQSSYGLAMLLPFWWAFLVRWRGCSRPQRVKAGEVALVGTGIALALSGWWYLAQDLPSWFSRSWAGLLPAIRSFPWPLATIYHRWSVSYWALFGWGNIEAPAFVATTLGILSLAALVGLTMLAARVHWKRGGLRRYAGHLVAVGIIWTLLSFAAALFVPGPEPWPAGHRLLAAIVPISLLLYVGIGSLVRDRFPWPSALAIAGMIAVSAMVPASTLAPAYREPSTITLGEIPETVEVVDIAFGDSIFLVGYELGSEVPSPGESVRLRLYWLPRQRSAANYMVDIVLVDRDQLVLGSLRTHPGNGNYPTSRWVPGEVIVDEYQVAIGSEVDVPVAAEVRVGLLTPQDLTPVDAKDLQGRPLGAYPRLGRVGISAHVPVAYLPANPSETVFGDQFMLEGYDRATTVSPGQPLDVTCYWRCLAAVPWDCTVFVHLLDARGRIVAQVDEQPLHDNYPTSYWRVDDRVRDPHTLALPPNTPPGAYTLRIGLYRVGTGDRLVITSGGPAEAVFLELGPVQVMGGGDG